MLHIVNKSPFTHINLNECLRFATKGAVILLIEDGVFAAKSETSYSATMTTALKEHEIYAIGADISARGIGSVTAGIKVTDYGGFVDLVEKHKTQSWL